MEASRLFLIKHVTRLSAPPQHLVPSLILTVCSAMATVFMGALQTFTVRTEVWTAVLWHAVAWPGVGLACLVGLS